MELEGVHITVSERGVGAPIRRGAQVLIDYTCTLRSGEQVDANPSFAVVCGVQDVVQGLDEALLTMREGDRAVVEVAAEKGYGSATMPGIPPNSPLAFRVHVVRVSNIPQSLAGVEEVVSARSIQLSDLLRESVVKKGALTITKTYEASQATSIAQEHLTLSALMQDYEDTFCSIIEDSPSVAHSHFFCKSLVHEATDCSIARAIVQSREFLCAKLLASVDGAASPFWSALLSHPCDIVIAVGDCILPDDAHGLKLGDVLVVEAVEEVGPGICKYTLVSVENSDRTITLCWMTEWRAGSIPANNIWLKFWNVYEQLVVADGVLQNICICEVSDQSHHDGGDEHSNLLSRTSCLAIVDAVVRQASAGLGTTSDSSAQVNIAQAYLDVSKCVRAGVTQSQYKFIYKAIRQALKNQV